MLLCLPHVFLSHFAIRSNGDLRGKEIAAQSLSVSFLVTLNTVSPPEPRLITSEVRSRSQSLFSEGSNVLS